MEVVVRVRENFKFLFCQVLYAHGPYTAFQIQIQSFPPLSLVSMPPKGKVLCICCNTHISVKLERQHRRDANAAPYAPPTPTHPSRQRSIFAPSSEVDSDESEAEDNAVAGPSNSRRTDEIPDPLTGKNNQSAFQLPVLIAIEDEGIASPGITTVDLELEEEPEDVFMDDNVDLSFADHYTRPVAGSDSDDTSESGADTDEEEMRDEDSDGEDPDEDIFDWDSFQAPDDGLSAWDKLGEEYEKEAALGTCSLSFSGNKYLTESLA